MFRVRKGMILVILIALAIGCYSIGFGRGAIALIIAGMLFELGFWVGLFKSFAKESPKENN